MKRIISILSAALLFVSVAGAQELANVSRNEKLVSPEVAAGAVTFRLDANYATTVSLWGNWMAYTDEPLPLQKGEKGIWSITIPNLEPEIYTYNFFVDGVSVNDPANEMVQRDGSRYLNMVLVPGARSANYSEADKRGNVTTLWYDSAILGINRRLTVYTPYGYDPSNKKVKYPVLYLLHGGGGDEEAWISMGRAAQILDNLIQQGKAVPMIIVMPNGNPNQQAASILGLPTTNLDTRNSANANIYVKSLVTEIIPFIEKNYRVNPKPVSRAIAGLSMGGGHTTAATILYPGTFSYICPMSCGIQESDHLNSDLQGIKKAGYKLYWIGCGSDDFAMPGSKVLDEALTRNGMQHTFYISDGGHEWKNWRLYLNTFAPLLFK